MRRETKVDRYLRRLERELDGLADDARAKVVAEVRAQIDKGRANGRSIDDVLTELGSPKLTAKAYHKPGGGAEPRPRWVRWFAVGTVVFFGLIFLGGLAVIWRLSPFKGEGGLRWWGRRPDGFSAYGRPAEAPATPIPGDAREVTGLRDLSALKVTRVRLPFLTGKLELKAAADQNLRWSCRASPGEEPRALVEGGVLTLTLDSLSVARCEVAVPANLQVEVRGANGHLEITRLAAALDVQLTNGRVSFRPDPARQYDVEVHVKNGLQDFFRRSTNPRAHKVKINVTNGTVKRE